MLYNLFQTIAFTDLLDILIVAALIYQILSLLSGTRAANLLKGLGLLLLLRIVAEHLRLYSLEWIIQAGMAVGLVAIIVIFQPELRAGLERIGRGGLLHAPVSTENMSEMVSAVVDAVQRMSRVRMGAIIVFERTTGLRDVVETGVAIHSTVTAE